MSEHNEILDTSMSKKMMNTTIRSIYTQCQSVSFFVNWTNWKSRKF